MLRTLLLNGLFLLTSTALLGQRQFEVHFDKISRKTEYFEIKKNGQKKRLGNIVPDEFDHIDVIVSNANPFLYRTSITFSVEEKIVNSGAKSANSLSMLQDFIGNSHLGALNAFLGNVGRGSMTASDFDACMADINKLNAAVSATFITGNELNSTLYSDYLTCDSIQSKVNDLIQVLENNIREGTNTRNKLFSDYYNFEGLREYIDKASSTYSQSLTLADLETIKAQVASIHVPFKQSFVVEFDETDSETAEEISVAQEIKGGALRININFFAQPSATQASEYTANPEDAVTYYFTDVWIDPNKEIHDEICDQCRPQVRATGFIDRDEVEVLRPFDILQLMNSQSYAYGIWTIYDKSGKVSSVIELSHPKINEPAEINEKRDQYTVILPTRDRNVPQFSTGIFFVSPFQGRNNFEKIYSPSGDSIMIANSNQKQFLPTLGSVLSFRLLGGRRNAITGNFGASIDILDAGSSGSGMNRLNFMTGFGFKNKSWDFLSISAGISYTQVNVLSQDIEDNTWYSEASTQFKAISEKEIKSVYRPGLYFGIHLNL